MNMWLHGNADAEIVQGNTLASPQFGDEASHQLKTFDYAVANLPFSYKSWMNGLDPTNDLYGRFDGYEAAPPKKNGDFAFLLHLIKSLKSTGKACIVLPLGVLFRGNAEADIRKKLIQRGYIKGIIGLPPNLFYGTGIAASLIVIDKAAAARRTHIFMIDASRGFIKDGNKNRLREQDIHRMVDTFNQQIEVPKYARLIPLDEIADPKNDYNLNIPRYIDSQEEEDAQDIAAHLLGGIPKRDVDALQKYWTVYPSLKAGLFETVPGRADYYQLTAPIADIKNRIFHHPEFTAFGAEMEAVFGAWRAETAVYVRSLDAGIKPKDEIHRLSERLLRQYADRPLTDPYAMYQHLMDYWFETMQDDLYELAADGWPAGNEVMRLMKVAKKNGKDVARPVPGLDGLDGRLIPPALLVQEYFAAERAAIDALEAEAESLGATMEELREEHGGEDGLLANATDDKGKISKGNLAKAIKELGKRTADTADEYDLLQTYRKTFEAEKKAQDRIKLALIELEREVIDQYPRLSLDEIKTVVVEKKWLRNIEQRIGTEMDNISHRLTQRIRELAERYETPLPELETAVDDIEQRVKGHLAAMGF